MTKFKKIFTRLFWSESQQEIILASNEEAEFNLKLGKMLVGTLLYSNGVWYFNYSDAFKIQNRISPITNFPSKEKEYSTKELWPFFASRIPSNAQLQLDMPREDVIALLRQFGRRTIANPFELAPS